jgi:tripartite motif-containing protein 71
MRERKALIFCSICILALFFLSITSLSWLPADVTAARSMEQYSFIRIWGSLCRIFDVDLACSIKETESQFRYPTGIALSSSGMIYITDSWNDRIQKFTPDGKLITKWGSRGSSDGQFRFPTGLAVDSAANVYVADFGNSRVQKFTADGKFITKWGSEGSENGQFSRPQGIAVDSAANVYVADFGNSRVQKFTADGKFITKWGSRGSGDGQFGYGDMVVFVGPTGIAVDSAANVYVADFGNSRVQKFTADGKFITKWGSEGSENGQFSRPQGIAVDSAANVYVADSGNERIQKFTADGRLITKWGSEASSQNDLNTLFEGLSGIAVESKYSTVYVTDTWNDNIQVFMPSTK